MTAYKTQQRILTAMTDLVRGKGWEALPSYSPTIRLTRTVETPGYAREKSQGRTPLWDQDTYNEYLFIALAGGKIIVSHGPCPWIRRSDSVEPVWYADQLLAAENPWDVLERRVEIKAARKEARS